MAQVWVGSEREGLLSGLRFGGEIQIFKPWADQVDVEKAEPALVPGRVPPASTPVPMRQIRGTCCFL